MFSKINKQNDIRIFFILSISLICLTQANAQTQTYTASPIYDANSASNPYSYILSKPVETLPSGYTTVVTTGGTYSYSDGIFYQRNTKEQKYIIVPPPIGATINSMPAGYQMMAIGKITYYQYNGIFYKHDLEGYKVVVPPAISI